MAWVGWGRSRCWVPAGDAGMAKRRRAGQHEWCGRPRGVVRHAPPTDSGAAQCERVGILGGAEEILCFSERTRRVGAIPLLGNGNEPAPTATEDSDPGTDAELEG